MTHKFALTQVLHQYIIKNMKTSDIPVEITIGKLMLKRKKTLAIAESCTGGLISSRITDIPGSSKYFQMGIVAYDNTIKAKFLLDVGANGHSPLLDRYGAVSRQVAIKMAEGVRKIAGTDIGLAVTGIAGPGGATKTKPIGLVYIALATTNKTICKKYNFSGNRTTIKWQASLAALDMLLNKLV